MSQDKLIKYSEIFKSIQGEGKYTGVPTIWLRLFLCNLNCDGFGQADPTNPDTYILPYKEIDAKRITMIEDIPVLKYGCDSSYSWSAKFKHLQHQNTAAEIVEKLSALVDESKLDKSLRADSLLNRWRLPFHLCFTGGEPLLKVSQPAIVDILKEYKKKGAAYPYNITFETNGTQVVTDELIAELSVGFHLENLVLFSYSPKLFSVSGEPKSRALKPKVIAQNIRRTNDFAEYQLKFVLNKNPAAWAEMEEFLDELAKETGNEYIRDHVYIMPVGADQEAQYDVAGEIADMAVERGYKVSARVHAYLWNNPVGK